MGQQGSIAVTVLDDIAWYVRKSDFEALPFPAKFLVQWGGERKHSTKTLWALFSTKAAEGRQERPTSLWEARELTETQRHTSTVDYCK
mmetsp:Transcript_9933/g.60669  ORF Transcript_9933/g.60669 Transcript_9933/m.60669 type:complete len:88 (+) Transcript_9933:560-823(+)